MISDNGCMNKHKACEMMNIAETVGYLVRILYVTVYGKTRHMGFFVKIEFDVSLISSTLELTPASLRPIARFTLEIARFVCDRATRIENEKLRSEGVAMNAYSVSVYYA